MTAVALADELGPRGRRRVAVATAISAAVLAAVLVVAGLRLSAKGQLDAALWRPFTQVEVLRFLGAGLIATLKAALTAMVLGVAVGALLALGRLARNGPVRWLAGAWVELFRAVPLLLLIFFCALGLPKYGIDLPVFWYLVLALVLYNGAVFGEIFRAGILSLDSGQTEAAYSVGLSYWQAMFTVVIPQAARRMIPSIVSQLVTLLKDTSLGFVITYEELLRRSRSTGEFFRNPLQTLTFVAVVYIIVNFILSRLARRLEVRQRRRYGASAITVTGVEDLTVTAVTADAKVNAPDAKAPIQRHLPSSSDGNRR